MTTELLWNAHARHDLARLDRRVADRVISAVVRYGETGHGDVRRLQGSDELRLRVGDWRVRFRTRVDQRPRLAPATGTELVRVIEILRVLPRGRAYRD